MQISETINKVAAGRHLTREEAREVMQLLLSGSVVDEEIVSFLAALRDKGERAEELVGFAEVMRDHAAETLVAAGVRLDGTSLPEPLLDTYGTGGDGMGHTTSRPRRHWLQRRPECTSPSMETAPSQPVWQRRRAGSPGVAMDLPLERIPQCLEEVGIVFLLAPRLHLAMKHVMKNARRSLKTKSVFNLLGPADQPPGGHRPTGGRIRRGTHRDDGGNAPSRGNPAGLRGGGLRRHG